MDGGLGERGVHITGRPAGAKEAAIVTGSESLSVKTSEPRNLQSSSSQSSHECMGSGQKSSPKNLFLAT